MSEKKSHAKPIMIRGDSALRSGCYLLRLQVVTPVAVQFGRFQDGRAVAVSAGSYLYIGSAMGKKGSSTLAHRLLRHASRQNGKSQTIRPFLLAKLRAAGLGTMQLKAPTIKTLFWHVDYLLEETAVDLTHIIILRSANQTEKTIAQKLAADPHTAPLARGLGASDDHGQTHLVRIPDSLTWWHNQLAKLAANLDTI